MSSSDKKQSHREKVLQRLQNLPRVDGTGFASATPPFQPVKKISPQVKLSWIEHFLNWYPRYTKLYRRRSKNDPSNYSDMVKLQFEELKPFFMMMEKSIKNETINKILDVINNQYYDEDIINNFSIERALSLIESEKEK